MKAELIGKKEEHGFVTLEILIAFTIIILCIGGVVIAGFGGQSSVVDVFFSNQSISTDLEINNEAISKAQVLLEKARADARFDFNLVNPYSITETTPYSTSKLDVETSVTDSALDFWTKRVTSTVSWQLGGRHLSTVLTTLLTNPNSDDTCGSVLFGDWENPQKTEYEFGAEILNDTSSGFPLTHISSYNKKLYVTVSNNNGNNDGTFFILDVSDPTVKPRKLAELDNSSSVSQGLSSVAVDTNTEYSYTANTYTGSLATCVEDNNCAQLQVIKNNCVDNNSDGIDDVCNSVIVKNFKINSVAASGKLAYGTSIFYKNGLVYLGLAKSNNEEFYIIDVGYGSGSPSNPQILDSFEIGNGINNIFIKNGYAYIASPNTLELIILNVVDPSNIRTAGNFNSSSGAGNGKSLDLVGDKLYLGVTVPNSGSDFHILDNHNPESTLTKIGPGLDLSSSVNGIIIRDYLAFLITNTNFEIWKINDPSNISQYATPLTLPPGGGGLEGTASDCEGNYLFVGSNGSSDKGYISVITSGVPQVYTLANSGDINVIQGSSSNNTITRTHISGGSSNVTLNVNGLPSGATASFTNNPCIPSPSCASTLTVSTISTTPVGSYPITVLGNGGVATTFNLIINEPFAYTITNPTALLLWRSATTVDFSVTVTKTSGTTQPVNITPPNPKPNQITILPSSASCTPSSTLPYSCTVIFTYKAKNGPTGTYLNQKMIGSPNSTTGTFFQITVN